RERGGGCRVTGIPTATCAREGVLHPRAIQGYWGKQGDHYAVQNRRARHDVCPCHPSGTLRSLSTAAGESLSHRDSRREFASAQLAGRQWRLATGLGGGGVRGRAERSSRVPLHGRERRPLPSAGGRTRP